MSNGDEGDGDSSMSDALASAGEIAGELGKTIGGIADAEDSNASGATAGLTQTLGGLAGAVGGALPESEAKQVLTAAGAVAETAGQLVGAGQRLAGAAQSGDLNKAASGLGSLGGAAGASRYIVPEHEAQQVLGGVGQAASALRGAPRCSMAWAGCWVASGTTTSRSTSR